MIIDIFIDTKCWIEIPDNQKTEEAFWPATIINLDPKKERAEVKYNEGINGPKDVKVEELMQRAENNQKTDDDMVNLQCLNDAELLLNLQLRFKQKKIFTYVGPTLLVVNPYQPIDGLLSDNTLFEYQRQIDMPIFHLKDLPPHVWAIAAETYRQLFENNKNQAIVISGESGAGKTENTKFAMKFLTSIGLFSS